MTLVEMLVVVVLLGVAVTAILTAVRTSTAAATVDEDHAITYSWLQAASDALYRAPREPCDTHHRTEIIATYDAVVSAASLRPTAWRDEPAAVITVTDVQFLGKPNADAAYEWGPAYCLEGGAYAAAPQYTQRISIEVTAPHGLVKTLHMVKGA